MLILSRQNRAIMKHSNDENKKIKIRKCERVEEKRNEIMNIDFVILRAFLLRDEVLRLLQVKPTFL
jgi:hypothetical protein